jgi:CubicO group peptidase (beta-lactamase class C family)
MLADGGTLDGVRVMKPATIALALSNLLPPGVFFERGGVRLGYGAGGYVTLADAPASGPAKGTYGWEGIAGTMAWVDPARRFRAAVMVNYLPADRWPVRDDTVRALAADGVRQ